MLDGSPRRLTVGFPRMHKEASERRDFLPPLIGPAGRQRRRGPRRERHRVRRWATPTSTTACSRRTCTSPTRTTATARTSSSCCGRPRAGTTCCGGAPSSSRCSTSRPGRRASQMLQRPRDRRDQPRPHRERRRPPARREPPQRRLERHRLRLRRARADLAGPAEPAPRRRSRSRSWAPGGSAGTPSSSPPSTATTPATRRSCGSGLPGVEVVTTGRNLTGDAAYLKGRLAMTDILVDATQRRDPSVPRRAERVDRPAAASTPSSATWSSIRTSLDVEPRIVRGDRGHPAGRPRPVGVRAGRPGLGRPAAGHPDGGAADRRVVLLVAGRSARAVHARLRLAAGAAPRDARHGRRHRRHRAGRVVPRAGAVARQPARLAGRGRGRPGRIRRPGSTPPAADAAAVPG